MKKLIIALILSTSILNAQEVAKKYICGAKTSKGTECKIKVEHEHDKCKFHNPNTPRCTFIKKDSTQCKMRVNEQQLFCKFHNKN